MPHLSDGQLAHIGKEAQEVLESLERRIQGMEQELSHGPQERDTLIKASTKRDVTRRFIRAIQDEQEHRQNNPALRSAAGESLPRTFLEVARHRLPGATSRKVRGSDSPAALLRAGLFWRCSCSS